MQTPEKFAESALEDERVTIWEHDAPEIAALADLIRARDAEVRADERGRCSVIHATLDDEALVAELVRRGVLEEKRENLLRPVQVPCDCEHPTHARLVGDDSPLTHVTSEVVSVVRYASRWQPDTRTPQQRSDDAVDELRRRLEEDA